MNLIQVIIEKLFSILNNMDTLEETELLIVGFLILGISNLIIFNIIFPKLEKEALEYKNNTKNCPHNKGQYYEKGFGARPYLRCCICDAIVYDE